MMKIIDRHLQVIYSRQIDNRKKRQREIKRKEGGKEGKKENLEMVDQIIT